MFERGEAVQGRVVGDGARCRSLSKRLRGELTGSRRKVALRDDIAAIRPRGRSAAIGSPAPRRRDGEDSAVRRLRARIQADPGPAAPPTARTCSSIPGASLAPARSRLRQRRAPSSAAGSEGSSATPLSEMSDYQRREFHEALLDADGFEDLPGKWQAAIFKAEANRPKLRLESDA
jgi:hypothetical protein